MLPCTIQSIEPAHPSLRERLIRCALSGPLAPAVPLTFTHKWNCRAGICIVRRHRLSPLSAQQARGRETISWGVGRRLAPPNPHPAFGSRLFRTKLPGVPGWRPTLCVWPSCWGRHPANGDFGGALRRQNPQKLIFFPSPALRARERREGNARQKNSTPESPHPGGLVEPHLD